MKSLCWSVLLLCSRRSRCAQEPALGLAGGYGQPRSPGLAGGGRAAPSTSATSRRSSKRSRRRASAASRSRPSTVARGSEARYVGFPVAAVDGDARAHDARSRSAWGSASTWRPAPAGPSAVRSVSTADGSSSLALLDGKLDWQTDRDEGETSGAGRRRPGARSLFDGRARSLPRALLEGIRRRSAARAGRCARQFHDSFEYYNASWTAALPDVFQKMHGYDIQSFAAQLGGEQPDRRRHAGPHQGRLPPHAREAAPRLRECVGDLGA